MLDHPVFEAPTPAPDHAATAGTPEPPAAALSWYGLRTLTRAEFAARDELAALGFEVCVPVYRTRTWPRKRRRSVVVERPLCPGYVFCLLPSGRWREVRSCRHVIGWIADNRGPLRIGRPEQLRELNIAALAGAYDDLGVEGRLKPGGELEILFGPFAGWRVAFMAIKGSSIDAEVAMFGTARRILIPAQDLHMRKG